MYFFRWLITDFAKEYPIRTVYLSGAAISSVYGTGASLVQDVSKNDTPDNFAKKVGLHILVLPVAFTLSLTWPAKAGKWLYDTCH